VVHTDSATEWWQFRSSLVDTDENGQRDLRHPHNVRRYLFASKQHFPTKGATPTRGTANRQCQQVNNQSHYGPSARALVVALDEWARHGRPPPETRVPTLKDGTLVPPDQASTGFPNIPGVAYTGRYNGSGDRDFVAQIFNLSRVSEAAHGLTCADAARWAKTHRESGDLHHPHR